MCPIQLDRRADENKHNTPLGNMVLHSELIACSKTIMLSGCGCFRLNRMGVVLIRKAEKTKTYQMPQALVPDMMAGP